MIQLASTRFLSCLDDPAIRRHLLKAIERFIRSDLGLISDGNDLPNLPP
jgi:hypothetical protein